MNYLKAALLKLSSTLCVALTAFQFRYFGADLPTGEFVFARGTATMIIITVLLVAKQRFWAGVHTRRPLEHLKRGLINVTGMFAMYLALARIPVVNVTAISFLAPIFTVVFAALVLHEHIRVYRWMAVVAGLCGGALIIMPAFGLAGHPTSPDALIGVGFAFFNAIGITAATLQVRSMIKTESTWAITFYVSLMGAVAGLLTLPFGWKMPIGLEWVALIGTAITGALTLLFLTESLRLAPASFIAPFDYTTIMWAFIIGFLFFGEQPSFYVVIGALIVAAAGLFVIWRERVLGLRQALEAKAANTP